MDNALLIPLRQIIHGLLTPLSDTTGNAIRCNTRRMNYHS